MEYFVNIIIQAEYPVLRTWELVQVHIWQLKGFSTIVASHLILRSSCQTLYTLSFSTVRVLFWFFELFDKEKYCHIWCTWMPSLLCESSHEISPLEGSHVFLQATWLWEALATLLHYSKTVSLLCGPIMSLQFTRSWWAAHARYCAPIVSLL